MNSLLSNMEPFVTNNHKAYCYSLYACGQNGLPKEISYLQQSYFLQKTFKHDFFAATGLYLRASSSMQSPEYLVLKVHRHQSFFGIPMSWLGRWLCKREQRMLQKLSDIENIPGVPSEWGKTGFLRRYIDGCSLEDRPAVSQEYFDRLSELVHTIHGRNIIYMDMNKRGNILLGKDEKPYLIDFQISLYLPPIRGLEWILRPIRNVLQKSDRYHVFKHKKRLRPDLVQSFEMASEGQMSLLVRLHRIILRPYRKLRHWIIRYLIQQGRIDMNSVQSHSTDNYVGHYVNAMTTDTKQPTGFIFDIKRYAIHDGPGIRTTVFFKGCPLRCLWCHNPESFSNKSQLMYRKNRCICCAQCIQVCPQNAIEKQQDGKMTILWNRCNACGACTRVCPSGALEMAGKEITVQEVMQEITKDTLFYDQSGGGVTFCGGEPLAQPEFLLALLKECRARNIHTAVDTSCYAKMKIIDSILDIADLFLCDIKHPNSAKHLEYVGVDNTIILDNIRYLAQKGQSVIIRVPVIPGFNDQPETIETIGKLVRQMKNIHRIDLLPYNSGGRHKSERIGLTYCLENVPEPNGQTMQNLTEILENMGFEVHIGG